jgi:hypothetical protein
VRASIAVALKLILELMGLGLCFKKRVGDIEGGRQGGVGVALEWAGALVVMSIKPRAVFGVSSEVQKWLATLVTSWGSSKFSSTRKIANEA